MLFWLGCWVNSCTPINLCLEAMGGILKPLGTIKDMMSYVELSCLLPQATLSASSLVGVSKGGIDSK